VAHSADRQALERARADIDDLATAFRSAADPALRSALARRLDVLLETRTDWSGGLGPEVREALRGAAAGAIAAAVEDVTERLADPELWRSPLTAPGVSPGREARWDGALPEWLSGALHRLARREDEASPLGELDDPANRIWVATLSAARALDPVLEEFGLPPASAPDLGGGHYGLQPRTAAQLDPSGRLVRIWKRYVLAYRRYAALEAAAGSTS
jgi:hypothetical protein